MEETELLAIHEAYIGGLMSPEDRAEYEADVQAGTMQLPQGKTLIQQEQVTAEVQAPVEAQAVPAQPVVDEGQRVAEKVPMEVFEAYFDKSMPLTDRLELAKDVAEGTIATPEGVSFERYERLEGMPPAYELKQERGFGDILTGVGETGLTLGTAATSGTVGQVVGTLQGLVKSIASGKFGTAEGADLVEKTANDLVQALTYEPKTEAGKEYAGAVGEALAPLEALAPMMPQAEILGRAARRPEVIRKGAEPAERMRVAQEAGIEPMTTDIMPPKTFVGKFAQATGERIPLAGTGDVRAAQQGQRTEAIRNVLREYGAVEAAQASDDVMASLLSKRSKDVNKYATAKSEVIQKLSDKGVVNVEKTVNTIDGEIAKLESLKTKGAKPAIDLLNDYKNSLQDQNMNNIELLRKQLGEELKAPDMASVKSTTEKAVGNIYGSLRDDMGDFIKANGDRNDFNKWMISNRRLSDMMGDLKNTTLKSTLAKGDATPELVNRMLFSQKLSDIKTLYKGLTPSGRANARSAILHQAVEKSGGIDNFSPERFGTNLKKLSKSTGVFFTGKDKQALDGLSKALEITKRGGIAGVKPTTGAELGVMATPTILSWWLGSDPATGLAATAGVGGLARIYESKPVRNALIKLANAPKTKEMPLTLGLISAIESQKEKEK